MKRILEYAYSLEDEGALQMNNRNIKISILGSIHKESAPGWVTKIMV
jgi:hypothetical protein